MKKYLYSLSLAIVFFIASLLQIHSSQVHAQLNTGGCGATEVYSAIGCIPVGDENSFGIFLINWGLGIGGGIAFLLIVYAGFIIITSSGNPQRLQSGKELLMAAMSGVLLLIFAVFILRLFGRDILGIL